MRKEYLSGITFDDDVSKTNPYIVAVTITRYNDQSKRSEVILSKDQLRDIYLYCCERIAENI